MSDLIDGIGAVATAAAAFAALRTARITQSQVQASQRPELVAPGPFGLIGRTGITRSVGSDAAFGFEIGFKNAGNGPARVTGALLTWLPNEPDPRWISIFGRAAIPVVPAQSEGDVQFLFDHYDSFDRATPFEYLNHNVRLQLKFTDSSGEPERLAVFSLAPQEEINPEGELDLEVLAMRTKEPLEPRGLLASRWASEGEHSAKASRFRRLIGIR